MTPANFLLAGLLATFYGALFHLVKGGGGSRLLFYLLAGWVGFGLGHVVGDLISLDVLAIGQLNIVPATLGAVMTLFLAHILAVRKPRDDDA